jgi:hypothetical protein
VFVLTLLLIATVMVTRSDASARPVQPSILVVGDSLISQATPALVALEPPGVGVRVASGLGTAPCDWVHGYRDILSHHQSSFSAALRHDHPDVVVLAFSGNPGLSGTSAGCVNASGPYTLSDLLTSYRQAMIEMGRQATAAGATVYLDATPARNPANPIGPRQDASGMVQYGFNGVPGLNELFLSLASSPLGLADHWFYDPTGAAALGGQPIGTAEATDVVMRWELNLPCQSVPTVSCPLDGSVRVRAGGTDAIHLDSGGAGATVLARALEYRPCRAVTQSRLAPLAR